MTENETFVDASMEDDTAPGVEAATTATTNTPSTLTGSGGWVSYEDKWTKGCQPFATVEEFYDKMPSDLADGLAGLCNFSHPIGLWALVDVGDATYRVVTLHGLDAPKSNTWGDIEHIVL